MHRSAVKSAVLLRDMGFPLPPLAYVVHHEDYISSFFDAGPRHAFDGRRPLRIISRLQQRGLLSANQVLRATIVSDEDLLRVHPRSYLEQIQRPQYLAELLTLPLEAIQQHEAPLISFYMQAGGTVMALRQALVKRIPTINLGGGFHHAQRDRGEGFCPINDIAVAIEVARAERRAQRFLVVDLDYHHGNGTALIYNSDEQVFTLSIHGQHWSHIEGKRNHIDIQLPAGTRDPIYLDALRNTLPDVLRRFHPQACVYVAGADPFALDQFGDFLISEEGMLERDLYVWNTLRQAGVPLAVVLAGGYGPLSWAIPYNFIDSVLSGMRIAEDDRPSNIEAEYRKVKEQLGPAQLTRGDENVSEEQLLGLMQAQRSSDLFMGAYTEEGIKTALERYGFANLLRERGFSGALMSLDTDDPNRQIVRVHIDQRDAEHLLIELIVGIRRLARPPDMEVAPDGLHVLSIEWLCMQNPRGSFSLDRPQLPGQRYPGLGLARWMLELLRMMAERLRCDGIINHPDHYHNARFYSRQMRFYDPVDEGRFQALRRLLDPLPLVEAAYAVDDGHVVELQSGQVLRWQGSPQLLPMHPALRAYLDGPAYRERVDAVRDATHFQLRGATTTPS